MSMRPFLTYAAVAVIFLCALAGCTAPAAPLETPAPSAPAMAIVNTPIPSPTPILTPVPTPTPAPSVRPGPTIEPASSPDKLVALSFSTDLAVFSVAGVNGSEEISVFYDLPRAPTMDEQAPYGNYVNQLVVPAAQVFRALGYEIKAEDASGITVVKDGVTTKYLVGKTDMEVDGKALPLPTGAKAPLWRNGSVWVYEACFAQNMLRVTDKTLVTFDLAEKNNAAGRERTLRRGRAMWEQFPK